MFPGLSTLDAVGGFEDTLLIVLFAGEIYLSSLRDRINE